MRAFDTNVLVHAEITNSSHHAIARRLLTEAGADTQPVRVVRRHSFRALSQNFGWSLLS